MVIRVFEEFVLGVFLDQSIQRDKIPSLIKALAVSIKLLWSLEFSKSRSTRSDEGLGCKY